MKRIDKCRVKKSLLLRAALIILWVHLSGLPLFAGNDKKSEKGNIAEKKEVAVEYKRARLELELDAYYTSVDLVLCLTDKPIPDVGEKSEFEIYKSLLLSSYLPRYLLLEASVNPMPCLGVFIKKNASGFYEDAELSEDLNLIKMITAGFEEPYAFSLFLGNVISFKKPGAKRKAGNNGYMGYLVSAGNYHIKDNQLINDSWHELEWKIKGDREFVDQKLQWSFRIGGKFHGNPEIADVFYVSLRRSRLDFEASASSILKNSGIEYTFDVDRRTFHGIRHYFSVDKKWPLKNKRFAFTLAIGFVWEDSRKYSGSLREEGGDNFQVFIQPNLEF